MTDSAPIRVMIVDDHTMVRRGLAAFLKSKADLQLVGEAGDGEEALRLCEVVQPDVILMDLVMPRLGGAEAMRLIRERWPQVQVIALTSFVEKELVQEALDAGAIGYLLKDVSTDELAEAIRAARAGQPTLASEAVQILALAEKLERLERAMLDVPLDASGLPDLLAEHVHGMFPHSHVEMRLFPDQTLLLHPEDHLPVAEPVWGWLRSTSKPHAFFPDAALPWGDRLAANEALIVAPIVDPETAEAIGGIYALRYQDPEAMASLLPAVQGLAIQIAWALRKARVRAQTLAQQWMVQELALAGQIQASFLPDAVPELGGWQLAATLEPARQVSGDFYDFIPLPQGRWGIVVADVADKGMGAALYMALSRTLLRTYAHKYHTRPDLVFSAANTRILTDTRADSFVSVFYGILDPATGTLTYCNAGHHPPYLLSGEDRGGVRRLYRTGMFLGVMEDAAWEQAAVQMSPGDVLLLYTDGVTDAQNRQEEFFGEERLLEVAQAHLAHSAQTIQDVVIAHVHDFVGNASQFDDITLMVLVRKR